MALPVTITSVGAILDAQALVASATNISSAAILQSIGAQEAKIWSKLQMRYALPINPVPPLVQVICIDLTVGDLLVKQAILQNTLADSKWPSFYSSVEAYLDCLANGDINLLDQSLQAIAATQLLAGTYMSSDNGALPTFTEAPFEYLRPDPTKVKGNIDDRWGT